MDKNSALKSLSAEKGAYVAFMDLKRQVNDWIQVADYANKILLIDAKIQLLNSITEVTDVVIPSAATLIRKEAQAIADKRAQRAADAEAAQEGK